MMLLSIFATLGIAFAGTGHVVGNGDSGSFDGTRVYVRDLWRAGAYKHPALNNEIDPTLPYSVIERKMSGIGVRGGHLKARLSDIERLFPGFGDTLIAIIATYDWTLTGDILSLPSIDGLYRNSDFPPGERLQLASRGNREIRISSMWWAKMDDFNRAGLVLQEAIAGVLPANCLNEACSQNSFFSRPTVGAFFNQKTVAGALSSPARLRHLQDSIESAVSVNLASLRTAAKVTAKDGSVTSINFNRVASLGEPAEALRIELLAPRIKVKPLTFGGFDELIKELLMIDSDASSGSLRSYEVRLFERSLVSEVLGFRARMVEQMIAH